MALRDIEYAMPSSRSGSVTRRSRSGRTTEAQRFNGTPRTEGQSRIEHRSRLHAHARYCRRRTRHHDRGSHVFAARERVQLAVCRRSCCSTSLANRASAGNAAKRNRPAFRRPVVEPDRQQSTSTPEANPHEK